MLSKRTGRIIAVNERFQVRNAVRHTLFIKLKTFWLPSYALYMCEDGELLRRCNYLLKEMHTILIEQTPLK